MREIVAWPRLLATLQLAQSLRRREVIAAVGAAAALWPLATTVQARMPMVGVLVVGAASSVKFLRIFQDAMLELGYVEGVHERFAARW